MINVFKLLNSKSDDSFADIVHNSHRILENLTRDQLNNMLNPLEIQLSEPMKTKLLQKSRNWVQQLCCLVTTSASRDILDKLLQVKSLTNAEQSELVLMLGWYNAHHKPRIDTACKALMTVDSLRRESHSFKGLKGGLSLSRHVKRQKNICCAYCNGSCEQGVLLKCKCSAMYLHQQCASAIAKQCPLCGEDFSNESKSFGPISKSELIDAFLHRSYFSQLAVEE